MSPRTGRPKADNPKEVKYSIRLDAETEQKLKEYCQKNATTKGAAIRRAIQQMLEKEN